MTSLTQNQVLHFSQGVNLLLKTDESEPKVKILNIIQQQNTSKFMPYYFLSLLHWFQKCHFLKIDSLYYFWVVVFSSGLTLLFKRSLVSGELRAHSSREKNWAARGHNNQKLNKTNALLLNLLGWNLSEFWNHSVLE